MQRFNNVLSYIKRKWWYLVLLLTSSIYVFYYRNDENIFQLKEFNAMNLIFVLWLVLLIFPLFSEMEFLGIRLKKEVEEAKKEVKDGLSDLRLQLMDLKISNSATNNITIEGSLRSAKGLDMLKEELQHNTENEIDLPEGSVDSEVVLDVSEQEVYLFSVRLSIEKSLSELYDKVGYDDFNGNKTVRKMLKHLIQMEAIPVNLFEPVTEIINICNRGIHGEIVSERYINFIKDVFPKVQNELKKADSDLNINVCPRCKLVWYSKFFNNCPKCGFINCD